MTVRQIIVITAEYYRVQISENVVEMYASDLADLEQDKVIDAYTRWRRNPANTKMPLPAEIRQLVCPEEFVSIETQAREIAARICAAVPKFGWCNSKEAQLFIGPVGWGVVQRQGGWSHLCENLGTRINITSFQAQLRDQVEGSLRYGTGAVELKILGPAQKKREQPELESMASITKLLPKKSEEDKDEGI